MPNSKGLSEAARIARNKYMREWRTKNPDKVRATKERYWEKKAAQMNSEKTEAEESDNGRM